MFLSIHIHFSQNVELLNVKVISFFFYLYFLSQLLNEDYIITIFSEDRR